MHVNTLLSSRDENGEDFLHFPFSDFWIFAPCASFHRGKNCFYTFTFTFSARLKFQFWNTRQCITITCVVDSEMNKFVWEWDTISGYAALFNFFLQVKSLLIQHCWRKGLYYNVIICSTNIDNQLSTKMIMCPILSFWNSTTTIQKVAWKTSWHQFELLGRCDARLTIYDATSEF